MAWVRLDDQFFRNPKVIAAGRDARDLYLAGLCYCGQGLTDGIIAPTVLRMLAADADIDDVRGAATQLVSVGLWTEIAGGYQVHDYHQYNPTSDKVKADRAAAAERMRNIRSPEVRPNNNGSSPEVRRLRPTPVNENVDDTKRRSPNARNARAEFPAEFEQFWATVVRKEPSKAKAFEAWQKAQGRTEATPEDIYTGLVRWVPVFRASDPEKVPHITTWLNQDRWTVENPVMPRASPVRVEPKLSAAQRFEAMAREDEAFR